MERRVKKVYWSTALFITALITSVTMEPRITSSMLMAGSGSGIVETTEAIARLSTLIPCALAAAMTALLLLAVKRAIAVPLLYMGFIGAFLAFDTLGAHLADHAYNNGRFILGLTALIYPLMCLGLMLAPGRSAQQRP